MLPKNRDQTARHQKTLLPLALVGMAAQFPTRELQTDKELAIRRSGLGEPVKMSYSSAVETGFRHMHCRERWPLARCMERVPDRGVNQPFRLYIVVEWRFGASATEADAIKPREHLSE